MNQAPKRSPSGVPRPNSKKLNPRAVQKRRIQEKRKARNRRMGLLVLLLLLIGATVFFAVQMGKRNAEPDPVHSVGSNNDGKPSQESIEPLKSGNVTYLPAFALEQFGVSLVPSGEDTFLLTLPSGQSASFRVGFADCVLNAQPSVLSALALYQNDKLYLPLDFYTDAISGINLTKIEEAYYLSADSLSFPDSSSEAVVTDAQKYLKILTEAPRFKADLSSYEPYLNPGATNEYLTLVNSNHALSSDYIPPDLTTVDDARYSGTYEAKLSLVAAKALNAFLQEAKANGIADVTVTSGYRSYDEQEYRFNAKVSELRPSYSTLEEAQNATANSIQWPGKSEHQTGLACDMHNLASADESFGTTAAGKWLADNAHQFGFILRYPEDKTNITGIQYEPWHFRYVGRYHATRMYLLNMTLEEYTVFMGLDSIKPSENR